MKVFFTRFVFSSWRSNSTFLIGLLSTTILFLLFSRLPDLWIRLQTTSTEGTSIAKEIVQAKELSMPAFFAENFFTFLSLSLIAYAIYLIRKQQKDRYQLFTTLEKGNRQYLLDSSEKSTTEKEIVSKLISNLKETTQFVVEISKGNYEAELLGATSEGTGKNTHNLAGALLEMKERTLRASQEEERRRWANEGVAKFAEILRSDRNLQILCDQLLSELVKYMGANQGALFLVNDEEPGRIFMEMKACYAYNRKKFINKEIEVGEGLVGQVYLEKEPIYLTEIPQDYVQITSGLGDANPKSILVVPLISKEKINGVIELASFREFQEHEILFCRKIAETISSTLSTFRVNERTRKLLEESQQQAEEMRAQEEEMRQNMEELEATQEEMDRVSSEMKGQLTAIDNTMATIEFDLQGNIQTANDNFLQLMEYDLNTIRGKHHRIFVESKEAQSISYKTFWEKLAAGENEIGEFKRVTRTGKEVYIKGIYNPIMDRSGKPKKILKIAYDITESKKMQLQVNRQLEDAQEKQQG